MTLTHNCADKRHVLLPCRVLVVVTAVWTFGLMSNPSPAAPAEPLSEFAEGLRDRRFFDAAHLYLDSLEQERRLPEELDTIIPYERALTYVENARAARYPSEKRDLLALAESHLDRFLRAVPEDHHLYGLANSEKGKILLGRSRVANYEWRDPANEKQQDELKIEARTTAQKARELFEAAHEHHAGEYERLRRYIDPRDEEQIEERRISEINYMKSQMDLAMAQYELAQSYKDDHADREMVLANAAGEFDRIHSQHRHLSGGLFARMFQGKCFEEQDELSKALGIYSELLEHEGNSVVMRKIKDQALQFRLICLNHPKLKDHELVEKEAQNWLASAGSRQNTEIGLGIRWELASAQEALGKSGDAESQVNEKYLKQAIQHARYISRYEGRYKGASAYMAHRLMALLQEEEGGAPKDFDSAYRVAAQFFNEISKYQQAVAQATGAEKAAAKSAFDIHLEKTLDAFKLTLTFVGPETDKVKVQQVRYYIAYTLFNMRRTYESAILGFDASKRVSNDDPNTSFAAGNIALVAFLSEFRKAPKKNQIDLQHAAEIFDFLAKNHSANESFADAQIQMATAYFAAREPEKAEKLFTSMPESDPRYPTALIQAGSSYLVAYSDAVRMPKEEQPPQDEIRKLRDKAKEFYRRGIDAMQNVTPADQSNDVLINAKRSLASLLRTDGETQAALDLLTKPPHAVADAIVVGQGVTRPATGLKSAATAQSVYSELMKTYMSLGKIEKALESKSRLEATGGAASTKILMDMGKELKKEIDTLTELGELERAEKQRAAFESFLHELFKTVDSQSGRSMEWIASMYFSLAETLEKKDAAKAKTYFARAGETYNKLLAKAAADPGFVSEKRIPAIRLKLIGCRSAQGEYEEALNQVVKILKDNPMSPMTQMKAAEVLEAWGSTGSKDSKKLKQALTGMTVDEGGTKVEIWGWFNLAKKLLAGSAKNEAFKIPAREARISFLECRVKYANAMSATAEKNGELRRVKTEVENIARMSSDIDDVHWRQYDAIYRNVQKNLGVAQPKPLEKPDGLTITQTENTDEGAETGTGNGSSETSSEETTASTQLEEKPKEKKKPAAEGGGSNTPLIGGIVVLLLIGGGVVAYMTMGKSRKKPRRSYGDGTTAGAVPPAKKPVRKPTGQPAKKNAQASGRTERIQIPGAGTKHPAAGSQPPRPVKKKVVKKKVVAQQPPQGTPVKKKIVKKKVVQAQGKPVVKKKRPPQT